MRALLRPQGITGGALGALRGELAGLMGSYRGAIVRTQLHSEAIAALQGAAVERGIVWRKYEQLMALQVRADGEKASHPKT